MRVAAIGLISTLWLATLVHADESTLKMRFVFDGDPPPAPQINRRPGIRPARVPVVGESLWVDPQSLGIRNVVVFVYTGRGGTKLKDRPHQAVKHRLTIENHRAEPRILLAREGDTLEFVNQGPAGHNLNIGFFRNPRPNIVLPAGKTKVIPLGGAQVVMSPINCNIYPWMQSFLVILDHRLVSVSDKDGTISISGLPSNTDLVFKVLHEEGRIDQVRIRGVLTDWKRARFKIRLSPGMNDLGDILIPAECFDRPAR